MKNSKSISTLIEENFKLTRESDGRIVDSTYHKGLIGSLKYLTAKKPDIVLEVEFPSRFMEDPCTSHLQGVKITIINKILCLRKFFS